MYTHEQRPMYTYTYTYLYKGYGNLWSSGIFWKDILLSYLKVTWRIMGCSNNLSSFCWWGNWVPESSCVSFTMSQLPRGKNVHPTSPVTCCVNEHKLQSCKLYPLHQQILLLYHLHPRITVIWIFAVSFLPSLYLHSFPKVNSATGNFETCYHPEH